MHKSKMELKDKAAQALLNWKPEIVKRWPALRSHSDIKRARWIVEMFLNDEEFLKKIIKMYGIK